MVKLIAIVAEEKTIVRIVARNGNGVIDVEIKEAIDTLKERVELIKKDYKREATDYLEVLEMAISALEKQIPKEPIDDEFRSKCCQNCGRCACELLSNRHMPYCEYCGQALKWGD